MKCKRCGKNSFFFKLCRNCNTLLKEGKISFCEECEEIKEDKKPLCKKCYDEKKKRIERENKLKEEEEERRKYEGINDKNIVDLVKKGIIEPEEGRRMCKIHNLIEKKEHMSAYLEMKELLEKFPQNEESIKPIRKNILKGLINECNKSKNHKDSIKYSKELLKIEPNNFHTLLGMSLTYYQLDDFINVKKTVEKIIDVNTDNKEFLKKLLDPVYRSIMPELYDFAHKRLFELETEKKKVLKTSKGLMVQSEGEKKIANFLEKHHIDFDYDEVITLEGRERNKNGYLKSWIRPDFYLTEFDIIIEYWGLKGTKDYDKRTVEKKRLYKEAGKRFISISPEDLKDIEETLKIKLKRLGCVVD